MTQPVGQWTTAPCVAVVDDDEDSALILQEFLTKRGVGAECFTAAENLITAEVERFDAVILDLHLPGMWGSQCSYELRRRGYDGLIIGLTGNLEHWDPEDLADLGFTCALGKPLDTRKLLECLASRPGPMQIAGRPSPD